MAFTVPINDDWKLIFDDEFNGDRLNTSKWTPNWLGNAGQITPPINSAELSAYDPAQVTVRDGAVHLKAEKRSVRASNGKTYAYASGCMTSNGCFNPAAPLFIEALVTCPGSGGKIANWPAFWLNGQNWPADGEIDIFEGLDGGASCHIHVPSGDPGYTEPGDFTGTHHYACLWNGSTVTFYYDGEQVWTITGMPASPKYVILNYALGEWGGPQLVPAEMTVAYVHAYSNAAGAKAVQPEDGYGGPGDDGSEAPPVGETPTPPDNAAAIAAIRSDLDAIKASTDSINKKVGEIETELDKMEGAS